MQGKRKESYVTLRYVTLRYVTSRDTVRYERKGRKGKECEVKVGKESEDTV